MVYIVVVHWTIRSARYRHASAIQQRQRIAMVGRKKVWRQMERGPRYWSKRVYISTTPRRSFLWFPESQPVSLPINRCLHLHGNEPKLGACLISILYCKGKATLENADKRNLYRNKINLVTQSTSVHLPSQNRLFRRETGTEVPFHRFGTMLMAMPFL